MTDKQPVYILPENATRMLGRDAQRNNILAAKIIAETVKTTLGPKGMDKMLVDATGDIIVTNDGVTILKEMEVEHPAAKMMIEIAKTQEEEVGDGTTTAVMLAGKLLENAESLLEKKIHPTTIIKGYRVASEKAKEILNNVAVDVKPEDKELLKKIAATAMTGKGAEAVKDKFAEIIVDALNQIEDNGKIDISAIKIEKAKGNGIEDTELIKGIVLDKDRVSIEMPAKVDNAKIVLIDSALEIKAPETDTKISISTPEQLQSFIDQEENLLKRMVEKIKEVGANVVFCQKGIDDIAQYYFAKFGIYACRRVAKSDMEKLARATSGKIVSNINEISTDQLGEAETVEEVKKGEESMTYIRGCKNPKSLTILLRGGTGHVLDEMERALMDGLGDVAAALKDGKIVAGGGSVEIELAKELRKFSQSLGGREQLAAEQFASALEFIPSTLAENAGLDPIEILTELKAKHDQDKKYFGLNLLNSKISDNLESGVIEPLRIKTQAVASATEVSMMILRIDDVIAANNKSSMPSMRSSQGMPSLE